MPGVAATAVVAERDGGGVFGPSAEITIWVGGVLPEEKKDEAKDKGKGAGKEAPKPEAKPAPTQA